MAEIVTVVDLNAERDLVRVSLVPPSCKSCRGGHCARSLRTLSARVAPEIAKRIETGCRVRIESSPSSIVRALVRLLVTPFVAGVGVFGGVGRFAAGGDEAARIIAAVAAACCAIGIVVARGSRRADLPVVRTVVDE